MSSLRAKIIMIIIFLTIRSVFYAQEEITIENLIENIGEETYSAPDLDIIEYYRDNPMNLRSVSADELALLPGISLMNAQIILKLVKDDPKIKNHKIADLIGLSPEGEILLDICTVNREVKEVKTRQGFNSRSRLRNRFEDVRGFSNERYIGSKDDIYNRLIAYYSDFEICGITNKHSGEPNLNEFSSGYIKYDNGNSRLIVGDYFADFGMGSLLWRQFAGRKGSEVISPVINLGNGISPYRSTLDFAHFRGVSAQTIQNLSSSLSLRFSGFYSDRDKSATLDDLTNEISSMYLSGYYRTENEINKKNVVNEEAIGANAEIKSSSGFTLGFTGLRLNYSHIINSKSSIAFSGKEGNLLSGYSTFQFDKNLLATELSFDANSNRMLRAGYVRSDINLDFAISARYIDQNFRSPYGYHFGEFSFPANEQGLYAGIFIKPNRNLRISFFGDIFSSIGRTYTVPGIVRGLDLFSEINYSPERKSNYTIRIRRDSKSEAFTVDNSNRQIGMGIKNSVRIEHTREIVKELTLRIRAEYTDYKDEFSVRDGDGIMAFMDLKWNALKNLKLGGRYTVFSTDNFSSAIYQYEYTMPGTMRTTALFGSGSRIILIAEYMPANFMKIYANIFSTFKNDTDFLGTGNEIIDGNIDSRAIIQVEFFLK
ncbi:MAG: hypothetical protein KIT33_02065 [Candidatus Kapabacteria bacterium]|nr:hypothetical protein [Ignavibacteriota bacterium]MCW5883737.1 hypothetical protein [Candidatus Kapabacteria bacterium]